MVGGLTLLPQPLQSSSLSAVFFLVPFVVPPLPASTHPSQSPLQETGPVAMVTSWSAGSFLAPSLHPSFS